MRRDAIFGVLVHFTRADLHFERFAVIINDRGVQRLVQIIFWRGDVIVKFVRDRAPVGVDDAQGRIAGRYIGHDQAHAAQVHQRCRKRLPFSTIFL